MIVVDTNIIAYLLLGGEKTHQAREVFQKDSAWAAPILEMRGRCGNEGTLVQTQLRDIDADYPRPPNWHTD